VLNSCYFCSLTPRFLAPLNRQEVNRRRTTNHFWLVRRRGSRKLLPTYVSLHISSIQRFFLSALCQYETDFSQGDLSLLKKIFDKEGRFGVDRQRRTVTIQRRTHQFRFVFMHCRKAMLFRGEYGLTRTIARFI
jgi:hypothetical protein